MSTLRYPLLIATLVLTALLLIQRPADAACCFCNDGFVSSANSCSACPAPGQCGNRGDTNQCNDGCAACDGCPTLTATPTVTPTRTATPTNTSTQTPTSTITNTATPTLAPSDLAISHIKGGAFTTCQQAQYVITVTNNGGEQTIGAFTVTDTLPVGLSYVSAVGQGWTCSATGQSVVCTYPGPLVGGGSATFVLTVFVDGPAYPTVTNTATVSFAGDANLANNTAAAPTTIRLGDQGTNCGEPPPANLDVSLVKTHTGSFRVCEIGVYDIAIRNTGTGGRGPTTGPIVVTDPLPQSLSFVSGSGTGWTCSANGQLVTCTYPGPLAPEEITTVHLSVFVKPEAYPTLTNWATLSTPGDENLNNNSGWDPTSVSSGTCLAGSTPTAQPTATAAVATPSATGTLNLPPTLTRTATLTRTPSSTAPTRTATPSPVPATDLALTVQRNDAFTTCSSASYTITVTNVGVGMTTGTITVTDVLPAGLTFAASSGTDWACSAAGQAVTCTRVQPLASGVGSPIRIEVFVDGAAYPTVTNSATVVVPGDTNMGNNTDWEPTTIRLGPLGLSCTAPTSLPTATLDFLDIALAKTHTGSFRVCEVGVYDIEIRNQGTGSRLSTTGAIVVTDDLPAPLIFVGGSGLGWACSAEGQLVTCTNPGPLLPGQSTVMQLSVYVTPAAYPTLTNWASVTTPGDGNASNNIQADPTTVYFGECPLAGPTPPPTATPVPTQATGSATPQPLAASSCELVLAHGYKGLPLPGNRLTYQLQWAETCAAPSAVTLNSLLPPELELESARSRGATATFDKNAATLRQASPTLSGSATIRARLRADVIPGTVVCNEAFLNDEFGQGASAKSCLRVVASRAGVRLSLRGPRRSSPGRSMKYGLTLRGLQPGNTLVTTLPEGVTLTDTSPVAPSIIDGRVLTFVDLPEKTRLVLTVRVDDDTAIRDILELRAVLQDDGSEDFQTTATSIR